MALADSQSVAVDQANDFVHALTANDGKLITQMRLSDGYVNATMMAQACKKKLNDYTRLKDTKAFLDGQAASTGFTALALVQQQQGKNGERHTWVHPEVAIDLARWCSVEFRIKVNRLVLRYLTGQLTTAESQAASEAAAQVVQVVDDSKHGVDVQALLDWHDKRGTAREATKAKSNVLHKVTGGKVNNWSYSKVNNAINRAATGKDTKTLREELKIKGTPRNHMTTAHLALVSYAEEMLVTKLESEREEHKRNLQAGEAERAATCFTQEVFNFAKKTGAHQKALLLHAPPKSEVLAKALTAPKPSKRQQGIIQFAKLATVPKALPAPAPMAVTAFDEDDLYA
jgi:hypothetical protein